MLDGQDVIDFEALAVRMEHDQELMAEVLQLFLAEGATLIPQLEGALAAEDFNKAAGLAHQMKGMGLNVEAAGIYRNALALESAASASSREIAVQALTDLKASWERLQPVVTRAVSRSG